jgi:hypothetical protein
MFIGPAILSILGISLVEVSKGWLSPRSVVYLVLLIAVVLARWFDPLDSYGQPTTPHQRQLELAFLVILALGGWLLANALGAYWKLEP